MQFSSHMYVYMPFIISAYAKKHFYHLSSSILAVQKSYAPQFGVKKIPRPLVDITCTPRVHVLTYGHMHVFLAHENAVFSQMWHVGYQVYGSLHAQFICYHPSNDFPMIFFWVDYTSERGSSVGRSPKSTKINKQPPKS